MELVNVCTITFSNISITIRCPTEEPYCCPVKKHKELWETWYFWFGVSLIFLFVITSATSYWASSCKRKQNLIRIRNLSQNPGSAPIISTISGPGGIIQPDIKHFNNQIGVLPSSLSDADKSVTDWASPLSAPYPHVEPVTIIRGSAPPQGFRQTNAYTEIVLPPGYVDSDYSKC